jgi:hypothetical protein
MSADILPFIRRRPGAQDSALGMPASNGARSHTPAELRSDSIVNALAGLAGPISCPSCDACLPWIVNGQCQQCLAMVPSDPQPAPDPGDRTDK